MGITATDDRGPETSTSDARVRIPIVPGPEVPLEAGERARLERIAQAIAAAEPHLALCAPFGDGVACGLAPGPALVIEDHSAIALYDPRSDAAYSYRALALAAEGDLAVVAGPRVAAFEAYVRETLGLGAVAIAVPAAAPGRGLAARARADRTLVARAAAMARLAGGLSVIPYMGTGDVWRLAGAIAAASGVPVSLAAPPPKLVQRANDKLWFADLVEAVLGPRAHPPSEPVWSLSALTARLAAFARRHAWVGVKVPGSASASGNFVLAAEEIAALGLEGVRREIAARLAAVGWRGAFPLMVTAWEAPLIASPSVQTWVGEDGEPVIEGVFEQRVEGRHGLFAGARPLPPSAPFVRRLAAEGARLALVLGRLGWFGRASFDAILVGERAEEAALHWVECNGRWGGVSIPMTLANRLIGDWHRGGLVVVDRSHRQARPRPFAEVLAALDHLLFVPGRRERGVVLLSPGRIESGSGYEFAVIAETVSAAEALAGTAVARAFPEPLPAEDSNGGTRPRGP